MSNIDKNLINYVLFFNVSSILKSQVHLILIFA